MVDTKDQSSGGEIFSSPPVSDYSQAASPLEESLAPEQQVPATPQAEYPPAEGASETPPPGDFQPGQPPFIEHRSIRKYIILGVIVLFLVLVIFFLIRFVGGLGSSKNKAPQLAALTYWGLWEDEVLMRPLIDAYQKIHPNVTITYVKQDPTQYRERLVARIDQGDGPDLFRFHNTWVPMLQNQLSPMPKTVYSDEEYGKTFYPVVLSDLKIGNNYYGIPLEIDGLVLFYNEKILQSANVPLPKTWVDVRDAVPKITVKQGKKIVTSAIALGTTENVEHFSDILTLMMLQNGTKLATSLTTCSDSTNMGCSAEALTFYHQFAEEPNSTWDDTLENSIVAFAGEKTAMIIAPSWEAFTIKALNPTLVFKTAQVPQLPCDRSPCPSVNWATYWVEGVSNKSKNAQSSWEFLKFLSNAESQQKLYAEQVKLRVLFGEPYSRVDLGKTLESNEYLSPLIKSAPSMKSFFTASRTSDGDTGLNSSLITYLKNAVNSLSEGTSAENALKTADSGFQQVLKQFGVVAPAQ